MRLQVSSPKPGRRARGEGTNKVSVRQGRGHAGALPTVCAPTANVAVHALCFQGVPDKTNGGIKKRRFYEEPAAERCTSDLGVCTEGAGKAAYSKWHGELMYMAALRPPYISAESRKGQFKRPKRTGAENELARFELADGTWLSVDTVFRGDEASVRQSTQGGNLPVAK